MVAIFPLTGVPLPFISYGGSSLIILFVCVGILSNISAYQIKKNK
jgi:cell division protein FtsW